MIRDDETMAGAIHCNTARATDMSQRSQFTVTQESRSSRSGNTVDGVAVEIDHPNPVSRVVGYVKVVIRIHREPANSLKTCIKRADTIRGGRARPGYRGDNGRGGTEGIPIKNICRATIGAAVVVLIAVQSARVGIFLIRPEQNMSGGDCDIATPK